MIGGSGGPSGGGGSGLGVSRFSNSAATEIWPHRFARSTVLPPASATKKRPWSAHTSTGLESIPAVPTSASGLFSFSNSHGSAISTWRFPNGTTLRSVP